MSERRGEVFPGQDLNLERLDQNQLCYQLHHREVWRRGTRQRADEPEWSGPKGQGPGPAFSQDPDPAGHTHPGAGAPWQLSFPTWTRTTTNRTRICRATNYTIAPAMPMIVSRRGTPGKEPAQAA